MARDRVGLALSIRAAIPETSGAAKEVPLEVVVPLLKSSTGRLSPGAETSTSDPCWEKLARTSPVVVAPTAITLVFEDGSRDGDEPGHAFAVLLPGAFEYRGAVNVGHADIKEDDIGDGNLELLQRLLTAVGLAHLHSDTTQNLR